jgi:hypothetical protein
MISMQYFIEIPFDRFLFMKFRSTGNPEGDIDGQDPKH